MIRALSQFSHTFQRMPLFNRLTVETQQAIAASANLHQYEADQVIYLEGEPAETVYVLEKGWVKAMRMTRDGREQAMMFLRPDEIFGDIVVLTGTTYPGTAVALEFVDVWAIPAKTVLELIENRSDLD